MKASKLTFALLPMVATMACVSPVALAQNEQELDLTITIMEEGEEPAGFISKIALPPQMLIAEPEAAAAGQSKVSPELDDEIDTASDILEEATTTVSDAIKDTLSVDGAAGLDGLPDEVIDNLPADLPLIDDLVEELDATELDDVLDSEVNAIDSSVDDAIDALMDESIDDGVDMDVIEMEAPEIDATELDAIELESIDTSTDSLNETLDALN